MCHPADVTHHFFCYARHRGVICSHQAPAPDAPDPSRRGKPENLRCGELNAVLAVQIIAVRQCLRIKEVLTPVYLISLPIIPKTMS